MSSLAYVVLPWLVFGVLNLALDRAAGTAGGRWSWQVGYHGAWVVTWTVVTLALGPWRTWLRAHARAVPSRVAGYVVALVTAAVADAVVRRTIAVLVAGGRTAPALGSMMLYAADATLASFAVALVLDRLRGAQHALVAHERQELALRGQLAHERLEQLEQQMQPHFLFNTLAAVSELLHEAPSAASRMLRGLADLVSATVEDERQFVTLREELSEVEAYVDIQRMRVADWLTVEMDADADAMPIPVLRFVLQPLVENAIRHGFAGRRSHGRIEISARREQDRLVLRVRDDGAGLSRGGSSAGWGIGLATVRQRLMLAYGTDHLFVLEDDPVGGTRAEVRVPLTIPIASNAAASGRAAIGDGVPPSSRDGTDAVDQMLGRIRRSAASHPVLTAVVAWGIWSVFLLQQNVAYFALRGTMPAGLVPRILLQDGIATALWILLTPAMLRLSRIPWRRFGHPLLGVLAHGVLAAALAVTHAVAWSLVATGGLVGFPGTYVSTMFVTVVIYGLFVGVAHHARLLDWLRQRALTNDQLKSELEVVPLEAVTARLRDVAFADRLEQLAARARHEPMTVEGELAVLGDELRAMLNQGGPGAAYPDVGPHPFSRR